MTGDVGKGAGVWSITGSAIFAWPLAFIHGTSGYIRHGTHVTGYLAEPLTFTQMAAAVPITNVQPDGRAIPTVVGSGINIKVQFSGTDQRTIDISWATLQSRHGCVDLSSSNGAVRIAAGASRFSDVTDPTVFRFPSHFARMTKDMIAIVQPEKSTFCVLVKLIDLFENDILFQWEVRNAQ